MFKAYKTTFKFKVQFKSDDTTETLNTFYKI